MASPSSPAPKHTAGISIPSPRHGRRGSVTFDKQTSVYPPSEGELKDGEDEEELLNSASGKWRSCYVLVEKRIYRQFFRFCAVVNILSLLLSPPFKYRQCKEDGSVPECVAVRAQFIVVTCVDLVLSLIYTLQTGVRVHYAFYLRKNKKSLQAPQFEHSDHGDFRGYTNWFKILSLTIITVSLWCSVAIGIYRSITDVNANTLVNVLLSILLIPRSLAIFSAMKLVVHLKLPYSALQDLLHTIKWKQLGYVALFYLFFIYIYALVGVQWIGGLSSRCVDKETESTIGSSPKPKNKPRVVLYGQPGASEENLRLKALKAQESSNAFTKKLNRWYFHFIEKGFLILVLVDAVVTAIKFPEMPNDLVEAQKWWQFTVSLLFLFEIAGLLLFHIYFNEHKPFFKSPYYWYLIILAVGGLVAAIPLDSRMFYNPKYIFNGFAIFQALRLPRLLRLNVTIKKFFFKVLGGGTRLAVVIVMTLVFIIWFSIISMQFFGFLDSEELCESVSVGHFDNFLQAMESTFQLMMQEGWTELSSEVMCHRDGWWIIMNFYFILVHLFASLILLNFFVAVILDNLDYTEEKKVKKLEQELKTHKIEKVPIHLKLFKCCGPKRVRVPKLSSVDAPSLTEADVRNFYNTGEAADFSRSPFHREPHIQPNTVQRQSSELSNLELLNKDSSDVMSNGIQGKYWGIQGILSYVKAFRQHSREQEEARPQDTLGGRATSYDYRSGVSSQLDTGSLVQSEYDEYREKYYLFDSALFCMPPEHKLRKFCQTILTAQMDPPKQKLSDTRPDQIKKIVKRIVTLIIRYIVSRLPYFTWVMFIITWVAIFVQVVESRVPPGVPFPNPRYFWPMDLIFVLFTLTELILKILANGFFLNPNAAIRSPWDVLDWIITLATLATMFIFLFTCGAEASVMFSFQNIPGWIRLMLIFRALRPMRTISLVPSMRRVIGDIVQGWRKFLLGILLLFLFMFMFANLGLQLFVGEDSPQGFCNDPTRSRDNCTGEFSINIDITQEFIPSNSTDISILVSRVWYPFRRDFRFDNIWWACLTLFEVLTLEGWLDLRDMFSSGDELTLDSSAWYMAIYLHIYIFFGVNLLLQLFVGIVVTNFNEHKPDHSALLTISQKRWTDLMQRISLTRPIKHPPEPSGDSVFRLYLYKLVVSRYYRHFSTILILLNSLMFVAPWSGTPEFRVSTEVLMILSIAFTLYFILEIGMKMLAFGPLKGYFHSWRNMLDFLLSLVGVGYIICAVIYLVPNGSTTVNIKMLADLALTLAILRCFTLLGKYSTFQSLTITVGTTIFRGVSLFGVIIAIGFTYAFVGIVFFSQVRPGEEIDYSLVNFNSIFASLSSVIRVMTGEDWHHLLGDTMTGEPYCSLAEDNCGNVVAAIIWFYTYYFFVTFILLNVLIAVLLENFSIFYNEDDTALSHAVVKDFKQMWYYFDTNASGSILAKKIKLFLRMLRLSKLYTYHIDDNGLKERRECSVLSEPLLLREMAEELKRDSRHGPRSDQLLEEEEEEGGETEGGKEERHSFQAVLKMLAYRAEDISKRLVPHELYVREELEESVQFDVAEMCILTWMKSFVKPVLMREQQRQRRLTRVSMIHRPAQPRREDTVFGLPMISVPTGDPWDTQHLSQLSVDTEDENEASLTFSVNRQRLSLQHPSLSLQHSNSEEQIDAYTSPDTHSPVDGGHENPKLARSYARLAQAPVVYFPQGPGAKDRDKWHDWFKMQRDWLDNVQNDPENYFDDFL